MFDTSYKSVTCIRRRMERHRVTGIDDRKRPGKKPLENEAAIAEAARELITSRPEVDQTGVGGFLFERFGQRLHQSTISRLLKKYEIPHKMTNKLYKRTKLVVSGMPRGRRKKVDMVGQVGGNVEAGRQVDGDAMLWGSGQTQQFPLPRSTVAPPQAIAYSSPYSTMPTSPSQQQPIAYSSPYQ